MHILTGVHGMNSHVIMLLVGAILVSGGYVTYIYIIEFRCLNQSVFCTHALFDLFTSSTFEFACCQCIHNVAGQALATVRFAVLLGRLVTRIVDLCDTQVQSL